MTAAQENIAQENIARWQDFANRIARRHGVQTADHTSTGAAPREVSRGTEPLTSPAKNRPLQRAIGLT